MEITEIISTTTSIITLLGILFAVFFYFKNPQEKLEKKQAINEEKDKNKAERIDFTVLKSNFDLICSANNEKFNKLEIQIKEAFAIANNHTNETDSKVTGLVADVGSLRNEITKLATIIEERIPKGCNIKL